MPKLHVKDVRILSELDFDARQPVSRIAKKVGLSPEAVSYRIKQLEKQGIITGYYPVIDLSKLGYMFCRLVLQLEKLTPEIENQFFEYMGKNPKMGWTLIADNSRVIMVGYAKTIQEAKQLSDDITFAFTTIIRKKYVSIATRIYHFKHKYLYNQVDDEQLLWGQEGDADIDDTDWKILRALTRNARAPATEISAHVGLTSMAVMNRIKKMQQEGLIQGYRFSLDLKKLGYLHVKTFLYAEQLTASRRKALIEFIRRWMFSVYITEAFGKADLEFECHVPTLYKLDEYIKKLRKEFPEVKSYENIIHYRENIRRYVPENFWKGD